MDAPEPTKSPDGGEHEAEPEEVVTERSLDRAREDEEYVSVIVKRSDAATRHPDDTLQDAIEEGLEQLHRPALSLLLSSIAAGLIVGFSAMAVAVVTTATLPMEVPILTRLATALVYPFGFVICVLSGAQLYTEHTATAVFPVLDRKASVASLLRLWILVICGNLMGALVIAGLLAAAEPIVQASMGYAEIGRHLTRFDTVPLLVSALLAGWLMALGAWLVMANPPGDSAIKSIYIVTFLIGVGGLHHSIAGSAEMFAALFIAGEFTVGEAARFIGIALLGNLIGGGVFVGVLNYAHIRRTQAMDESAAFEQGE
jgi:formate/nitrite transporter FocA (FNT family)